MTAALATLTLVLCGQTPDAFTLRFDGFTSAQDMRADRLTLLLHAAFEAVSDEPDSHFAVVDTGPADVVVTAMEAPVEEQLGFRYFLTTTRCPVRTTELTLLRPRKAVDTEAARGMARAVAKKAESLLREKVGDEAMACAEPGESLGGSVASSDLIVDPGPGVPGGGGGGAAWWGGGYLPLSSPARPGASTPRGGGGAPPPASPVAGSARPTGMTAIFTTSGAPTPSSGSGSVFLGSNHTAFNTPIQSRPASSGGSAGGSTVHSGGTTATPTGHRGGTGSVVRVR
jgi:hypothetical protein